MRLTANIIKAIHMAHKQTCSRCLGGSPCPEEINLYIQFKTAVLTDRPARSILRSDPVGAFRRKL